MDFVSRLDPRDLVIPPAAPGSGRIPGAVDEREGEGKTLISLGTWASPVAAAPVSYDENEFCVIMEGTVRLSDASGASETFGPGEGFIIATGFKGVWESVTPVRKWYVLYR